MRLYNGFTGEQLNTEIFIGPTYYMTKTYGKR